MADIMTEMVVYLLADVPLSALIGGRLYPLKIDEDNDGDCIVYQRVSNPPEITHSGQGGPYHPRIQLDCYGVTYASSIAVANALRAAMGGYKGPMGSITVQASFVDAQKDDYDPTLRMYRQIVDAIIWH